MPTIPNKTCKKCSKERPLTHFWIDKKRADGRWDSCRYCERMEVRRKRARIRHRIHEANYRKTYPEIVAAHHAVRQALRHGELTRPEHCEQCDKPAVDSHHEDYMQPLKVNWFCGTHHIFEHRGRQLLVDREHGILCLSPKVINEASGGEANRTSRAS